MSLHLHLRHRVVVAVTAAALLGLVAALACSSERVPSAPARVADEPPTSSAQGSAGAAPRVLDPRTLPPRAPGAATLPVPTPQPAAPAPAPSVTAPSVAAPSVAAPSVAAPSVRGPSGTAVATPAPATASAAFLREPADKPLPRQVERPWMSLAEWSKRHQAQLKAPQRDKARVAFLGDSITEGFGYSAGYREHFQSLRPLNLGIGGDQTQHVLWRLGQGSLRGVPAEVVVVMIGVNNLGEDESPEETALGVRAVVRATQAEAEGAQILLLGLLPAGRTLSDKLRAGVTATNSLLSSTAWPASVHYHDVGAGFVGPDGVIPETLMADALHPTAEGYRLLAEAIAPLVGGLMR